MDRKNEYLKDGKIHGMTVEEAIKSYRAAVAAKVEAAKRDTNYLRGLRALSRNEEAFRKSMENARAIKIIIARAVREDNRRDAARGYGEQVDADSDSADNVRYYHPDVNLEEYDRNSSRKFRRYIQRMIEESKRLRRQDKAKKKARKIAKENARKNAISLRSGAGATADAGAASKANKLDKA